MATNKPADISSKIWASLGDVETPTDAKMETGWQAEVPKAQVENWVQNRQDAFNAHVNERGIAEWDATTDYIANKSYVQDSSGTVYRAVQNTGPSTVVQNPATDNTSSYWVVAFAGGSLDVYTKGQSDARFVKNSELPEASAIPGRLDELEQFESDLGDAGDPEKGSSLVGFKAPGSAVETRTLRDKADESVSLRDYGAKADGVTDCWPALTAAYTAGYRTMRLELLPGESGIAYFGVSSPLSQPITIDFDPRITISAPNFHTKSSGGLPYRFINGHRNIIRALNCERTIVSSVGLLANANGAVKTMPYLSAADADLSRVVGINPSTQMTARSIAWPSADSWTDEAFSETTAHSFKFDAIPQDNKFYCGFVRTLPGDEITASFSAGMDSTRPFVGAFIRYEGGHCGVYGVATGIPGNITRFVKNTGQAVVAQSFARLGMLDNGNFSPLGAMWRIEVDSWNSCAIYFNSRVVTRFVTPGPISEVGFGAFAQSASTYFTASYLTRTDRSPRGAGDFWNVIVYGDSKSAPDHGDWPFYLKDTLEFSAGARCPVVTNRAVPGDATGQALLRSQEDFDSGLLAQHNLVVIDIGTNNIQISAPTSVLVTHVQEMIGLAQSVGARVILGVPSMWYTQAQAGDHGQASSNYDKGAEIRAAIIRLAADNGLRVVDNTRLHGPVIANYVNPALTPDYTAAGDPAVYDNIHPTVESNRRTALAYAKAIIGYHVERAPSVYLPPNPCVTPQNGWEITTEAPSVVIDASGVALLSGVIRAGSGAVREDGTVIGVLPEYMRPARTQRVLACTNISTVARLTVTPSGNIEVRGASTIDYVDLSCLRYPLITRF